MTDFGRSVNKRKADVYPDITNSTSSDPTLVSAKSESVSAIDANDDGVQLTPDWVLTNGPERNASNKDEKSGNSKDADAVLAEELLKLSFDDRNIVNEEIHGVRSLAVEEIPLLITISLNSFRIELALLPNEQKQAYLYIQAYQQQEGQQQHHHRQQRQRTSNYNGMQHAMPVSQTGIFGAYAEDDNFRLRFLRCCLFKVPVAVRRFANYLNFIQTYWGNSYLARPIQLIDLNATEQKILKRGWTQMLPFRDRRGRRVIAQLSDGSNIEDVDCVKVWFYVFDCASRDSIESQRNGVVSILDGARHESSKKSEADPNFFLFNPETSKRFRNMLRLGSSMSPLVHAYSAMPTRVVSMHICWQHTPLMQSIMRLYFFNNQELIGSTSALEASRVKVNNGLETEMRYRVKSYGIPIELMPLTGTNVVKLNYHNQWMKTRRLVESNQNKYRFQYNCGYKPEYECGFDIDGNNTELVTIVECPCSNDVVFRNGTQSMENPGNVMFRNSILSYWSESERTRSSENNKNSSNDGKKNRASATTSAADDAQDRTFRDELVRDIERKGRFLEWDKNLNAWVQMKDKGRIHRKVGMAFYNCTKRRYNNSNSTYSNGKNKKRMKSAPVIRDNASLAFQFIGKGGGQTVSNGRECCFIDSNSTASNNNSDVDEMSGIRACL